MVKNKTNKQFIITFLWVGCWYCFILFTIPSHARFMYWVNPRFFETVVLVSRHLFLRPRDANWRFCVASCCWTFLHFSLKSARSLSILWYGMRRRTKQEVSKMVTLGQTNIDVENQWASAILRGTSSISGPCSTFILAYRRAVGYL